MRIAALLYSSINTGLTYEQQMRAYQHALLHIMEHDFEKESADDIENDIEKAM